jgi:hypothetical protein
MLIWVPSAWVAAGLGRRAAELVREQAEACLRCEPLRNVISGAC